MAQVVQDAGKEITYRKFGPVRLSPGVMRYQMLVYYISTVTALMIMTFNPQAQPFLLTEILGVPESQQGALSGNLAFVGEIVILFSIGGWGTLSDKIGRKFVYGAGFLLMGIALFLMPTVTTVPMLYLYRSLFALGAASVSTMLATIVADYAINEDRGKASGLQGIGNGLGAMMTVFIALQLPRIFMNNDATALEAAQRTYGLVAMVAILSAILMIIGLQGRSKRQKEQKKSIWQISREGFAAAKDPGVALAYMAAFVSRGDLAIVGTFFTLWVVTYGTAEAGLSTADALARAGIVIGISQLTSLIFAPLFGIMADRINRVNAVIIAVFISAVGYGSTILVDDPTGGAMIFICAIIIGMGEISGVIASGVLIAQQAPSEIRGSIIGIFSLCGAFGIMVATGVGGQLFDSWRPQGPFVLFSIFSVIVVVFGLIVRNRVVPLNEEIESVGGH